MFLVIDLITASALRPSGVRRTAHQFDVRSYSCSAVSASWPVLIKRELCEHVGHTSK
jgi:hypothetical protein